MVRRDRRTDCGRTSPPPMCERPTEARFEPALTMAARPPHRGPATSIRTGSAMSLTQQGRVRAHRTRCLPRGRTPATSRHHREHRAERHPAGLATTLWIVRPSRLPKRSVSANTSRREGMSMTVRVACCGRPQRAGPGSSLDRPLARVNPPEEHCCTRASARGAGVYDDLRPAASTESARSSCPVCVG